MLTISVSLLHLEQWCKISMAPHFKGPKKYGYYKTPTTSQRLVSKINKITKYI